MKHWHIIAASFLGLGNCLGQNMVSGKLIQPDSSVVSFGTIELLKGQTVLKSTVTNFDGHFLFSETSSDQGLKLIAKYSQCVSDTSLVSDSKVQIIKIILSNECDKTEITNCRIGFIKDASYYIGLINENDSFLTVIQGVEFNKIPNLSPYGFELIESDKKYRTDRGQIIRGEQLIEAKYLALDDWEYNRFEPQ
jgi:hypothetical protein